MERKPIKSYTSIWRVDRVLYAISDMPLPFPMTGHQIGWFVGTFMIMLLFGGVLPLPLMDNIIVRYIVIPVFVTWFMNQKSFGGKRPYKYIQGIVWYILRPKETFAGKAVRYRKVCFKERITAVQSGMYRRIEHVSDKIY